MLKSFTDSLPSWVSGSSNKYALLNTEPAQPAKKSEEKGQRKYSKAHSVKTYLKEESAAILSLQSVFELKAEFLSFVNSASEMFQKAPATISSLEDYAFFQDTVGHVAVVASGVTIGAGTFFAMFKLYGDAVNSAAQMKSANISDYVRAAWRSRKESISHGFATFGKGLLMPLAFGFYDGPFEFRVEDNFSTFERYASDLRITAEQRAQFILGMTLFAIAFAQELYEPSLNDEEITRRMQAVTRQFKARYGDSLAKQMCQGTTEDQRRASYEAFRCKYYETEAGQKAGLFTLPHVQQYYANMRIAAGKYVINTNYQEHRRMHADLGHSAVEIIAQKELALRKKGRLNDEEFLETELDVHKSPSPLNERNKRVSSEYKYRPDQKMARLSGYVNDTLQPSLLRMFEDLRELVGKDFDRIAKEFTIGHINRHKKGHDKIVGGLRYGIEEERIKIQELSGLDNLFARTNRQMTDKDFKDSLLTNNMAEPLLASVVRPTHLQNFRGSLQEILAVRRSHLEILLAESLGLTLNDQGKKILAVAKSNKELVRLAGVMHAHIHESISKTLTAQTVIDIYARIFSCRFLERKAGINYPETNTDDLIADMAFTKAKAWRKLYDQALTWLRPGRRRNIFGKIWAKISSDDDDKLADDINERIDVVVKVLHDFVDKNAVDALDRPIVRGRKTTSVQKYKAGSKKHDQRHEHEKVTTDTKQRRELAEYNAKTEADKFEEVKKKESSWAAYLISLFMTMLGHISGTISASANGALAAYAGYLMIAVLHLSLAMQFAIMGTLAFAGFISSFTLTRNAVATSFRDIAIAVTQGSKSLQPIQRPARFWLTMAVILFALAAGIAAALFAGMATITLCDAFLAQWIILPHALVVALALVFGITTGVAAASLMGRGAHYEMLELRQIYKGKEEGLISRFSKLNVLQKTCSVFAGVLGLAFAIGTGFTGFLSAKALLPTILSVVHLGLSATPLAMLAGILSIAYGVLTLFLVFRPLQQKLVNTDTWAQYSAAQKRWWVLSGLTGLAYRALPALMLFGLPLLGVPLAWPLIVGAVASFLFFFAVTKYIERNKLQVNVHKEEIELKGVTEPERNDELEPLDPDSDKKPEKKEDLSHEVSKSQSDELQDDSGHVADQSLAPHNNKNGAGASPNEAVALQYAHGLGNTVGAMDTVVPKPRGAVVEASKPTAATITKEQPIAEGSAQTAEKMGAFAATAPAPQKPAHRFTQTALAAALANMGKFAQAHPVEKPLTAEVVQPTPIVGAAQKAEALSAQQSRSMERLLSVSPGQTFLTDRFTSATNVMDQLMAPANPRLADDKSSFLAPNVAGQRVFISV